MPPRRKRYLDNTAPADNTANVVRPVNRMIQVKQKDTPARRREEQRKSEVRKEQGRFPANPRQASIGPYREKTALDKAGGRLYAEAEQRRKDAEDRKAAGVVLNSLFKPILPSTYVNVASAIKNGQVNNLTSALAAPYLSDSWSMRNPGKALVVDIAAPFALGKGVQLVDKSTRGLRLAKAMNRGLQSPEGMFYNEGLRPYFGRSYSINNPYSYRLNKGIRDYFYNGVYSQRVPKSNLTGAERGGIPKGERNNQINISPDNIYGNIRFIRNFNDLPVVDEKGMVKLIGNESNLLGNFTTDLPFRLHRGYPIPPGANYMVVSPRAFSGKKFLSIDPGDSFLYRGDAVVDPKYVRIISGDPNVLAEASKRGMRTTTSDELQRLHKVGTDVTKKEYEAGLNGAIRPFPNADAAADNLRWYGRLDLYPKEGVVVPYRREVDRLITDAIGRPTLQDYRALEAMTGLDAHLSSKFNEALIGNASDNLVSPNMFKHIYYDVTPSIEGKLMEDIGLYAHPHDSFSNYLTIRSWLGRNKVKPLK